MTRAADWLRALTSNIFSQYKEESGIEFLFQEIEPSYSPTSSSETKCPGGTLKFASSLSTPTNIYLISYSTKQKKRKEAFSLRFDNYKIQ